MTTMQIRASGTHEAYKCSESIMPVESPTELTVEGELPDIRVDEVNPMGEMGVAVHSYCATLGIDEHVSIADLADRFDIDAEELHIVTGMARKHWTNSLAQHFQGSAIEQSLKWVDEDRGITVTGTADRLAIHEDIAFLLDWKSGWLIGDHEFQMMTYALLVLMLCPGISKVWVCICWIRSSEAKGVEYTRSQVMKWWDDTSTRILNNRGKFTPGGHCDYCTRRYSCPAKTAMMQSTINSFVTPTEDNPLLDLTQPLEVIGPQLADAYRMLKLVESEVEGFRAAFRNLIASHGKIPTGKGTAFVLKEYSRRKIDTGRAWALLRSHLSDGELTEILTVSLTKAEEIVGSKADKGKKGKAIKAFGKHLADAGGLVVYPTYRLTEIQDRPQEDA